MEELPLAEALAAQLRQHLRDANAQARHAAPNAAGGRKPPAPVL